MFSSPLPYRQPDPNDRYSNALPPPVPASPLRPPPVPVPVHANTYAPEQQHQTGWAHTWSAPGVMTRDTMRDGSDQWSGYQSFGAYQGDGQGSCVSSPPAQEPDLSDPFHRLSLQEPGGGMAGGESEGEKLVRLMSRRKGGGSLPTATARMAEDTWQTRCDPAPWQTTYSPPPHSTYDLSPPSHPKYDATFPPQTAYDISPPPHIYNSSPPPQTTYSPPPPHIYNPSPPPQTTYSPPPLQPSYGPSPPPQTTYDAPPTHAPTRFEKYKPSLPIFTNESAEPSGTVTPLPVYAPIAPGTGAGAAGPSSASGSGESQTSFLDAIAFVPDEKARKEVKMPAGEDYASIPSYGAWDSEESEVGEEVEGEEGEQVTTEEEDQVTTEEEEQVTTEEEQRTELGRVGSVNSYAVGDDALMTAKQPQIPPTEAAKPPAEKRTLVFSHHPPPPHASESTLSVPPKSTLPPQIGLFLPPTSFQLLSTSLKRLLADLMISADTVFVPSASAYAESEQERPQWRVQVWVRTFALPGPLGGRILSGGFRTMVGIELDEFTSSSQQTPLRPVHSRASTSSLALTRTKSNVVDAGVPTQPIATTMDTGNTLIPTFVSSYVLRLHLTNPLTIPFTAAQLVEALHRHFKYGQRIARSATASLSPGTVEENAYSFWRMIDRAPGPVDDSARLSKAHKLGRTMAAAAAAVREEDREDIQGQAGKKGFRYTMRKAVSKAVGAVQSEREETVEDDRANWVTPFKG